MVDLGELSAYCSHSSSGFARASLFSPFEAS